MQEFGRILVILGIAIIVAGLALMVVPKIPWLGHLPGDFHVERGGWSFHFPLATSIVLSVLLTLVLWLLGRR